MDEVNNHNLRRFWHAGLDQKKEESIAFGRSDGGAPLLTVTIPGGSSVARRRLITARHVSGAIVVAPLFSCLFPGYPRFVGAAALFPRFFENKKTAEENPRPLCCRASSG